MKRTHPQFLIECHGVARIFELLGVHEDLFSLTDDSEDIMRCDMCGNNYDKPLLIEYQGERYAFDCFECAITALAPECARCGTRIIGHGVEAQSQFYCSAHCAQQMGYELRDRI